MRVASRLAPTAPLGLCPEPVPVSAIRRVSTDADEQWTGSKKQRDTLRAKFDGRCAYCGDPLDKMHADHKEPVVRVTRDCMGKPLPADECYMVKPERNVVANMMPACAPCNLHKGGYSLEGWRDVIQRSADIARKATSTFKAGERFGIILVIDRPVQFFFERFAEGGCAQ